MYVSKDGVQSKAQKTEKVGTRNGCVTGCCVTLFGARSPPARSLLLASATPLAECQWPAMQSLQEHWLDALSEFLAAFLHLTLYVTEVYPATAFEPKQIYSTRVYQCRHPQVISYVATAVKQLKVGPQRGAARPP